MIDTQRQQRRTDQHRRQKMIDMAVLFVRREQLLGEELQPDQQETQDQRFAQHAGEAFQTAQQTPDRRPHLRRRQAVQFRRRWRRRRDAPRAVDDQGKQSKRGEDQQSDEKGAMLEDMRKERFKEGTAEKQGRIDARRRLPELAANDARKAIGMQQDPAKDRCHAKKINCAERCRGPLQQIAPHPETQIQINEQNYGDQPDEITRGLVVDAGVTQLAGNQDGAHGQSGEDQQRQPQAAVALPEQCCRKLDEGRGLPQELQQQRGQKEHDRIGILGGAQANQAHGQQDFQTSGDRAAGSVETKKGSVGQSEKEHALGFEHRGHRVGRKLEGGEQHHRAECKGGDPGEPVGSVPQSDGKQRHEEQAIEEERYGRIDLRRWLKQAKQRQSDCRTHRRPGVAVDKITRRRAPAAPVAKVLITIEGLDHTHIAVRLKHVSRSADRFELLPALPQTGGDDGEDGNGQRRGGQAERTNQGFAGCAHRFAQVKLVFR